MSKGQKGHAHDVAGRTVEVNPLATPSNANEELIWKQTTSHADLPTQTRTIPHLAAVAFLGTLMGLVFYSNTLGCTRWTDLQDKCQAFEYLGGIVRGMDCFKAGISYALGTLLAALVGIFVVDVLATPSEHQEAKATRVTSAPGTPQTQQRPQDTCKFPNIEKRSTI